MGGGSTGVSPIDTWREELEENAAARSQADEEQKAANAKVNQDAVLDALPVVGNYRAARRAMESGELALVHNRNQRSGEFAKHAGLFGADALAALSPLPFGKLARATTQGASSRTNIFGGIGAKTADHSALERAKDMQKSGADRADIWKETGWFQGAEGKWKFEIDDSGARMTPTAEHILNPNTPPERATGNLGVFFEHPELAKAYPDAPHGSATLQRGYGHGAWYDYGGKMELEPQNVPEAKRITLHELQHRVQRDEGFAPGGDMFASVQGQEAFWAEKSKLFQEMIENPALAEKFDHGTLFRMAHEKAKEKLNRDWYHRNAGEVEARNVEARSAMDAEGRRNLPPWETQDVPEADELVNGILPGAPQNVFMPAPASKRAEKAFQMRDEGASNQDIAKETRRFFGHEGKLRVEADDYNVPLNTGMVQPGDIRELQDVFPHHGVFSHHKDLKSAPVRFVEPRLNNTDSAFKGPDGLFTLPLTGDKGWEREQIAKLMQYGLAEKSGFSAGVTHSAEKTLKDYSDTIKRVQDIIDNPKPGDDLGAALAWQEHAQPMFKRLTEAVDSPDFSKFNRLSKRFAGNSEVRAVRARSGGANKVYPYDPQQWLATVAIPQQKLTRDELSEFLANWKNYGVGRDLFGDK